MSETHADETSVGGADADAEVDAAPDAEVDRDVEGDASADGETTEADETEEGREDSHLDGVDAGCGCAEVWETLSEERGE